MALEGDLRFFALPDILQVISHQQKTGILTVQGEQDILAVSFLRGEIVAADALNQSFEDGLGEVLASQGVMRPDDFQRYSEEHRASGERFSEFLVQRGALSRAQLLLALRVQTYRLLLHVLRWREGEFKFYSGEEVSYEEGMVPIGVEEVLLRSVGDLVGEGTLSGTLPHGFVAYERLSSARPVRVGAAAADVPGIEPDTVWITPDEKTVLDRLDGRSTADEIARGSGLGEYKTLYALFRLLRSGLARPAGEPGYSATEAEPLPAPVATPGPLLGPAPGPKLGPAPGPTPARAPAAPAQPALAAAARPERRLAQALAAVAAAVALAVLAAAFLGPSRMLLPFPGQEGPRAALEKQRRIGRNIVLDRGARTFYLLEGRYPASIEELVGRRLAPERALRDPAGARLTLESEAETYRIHPVERGETASEPGVADSIAGDFLLDPKFFAGLREEVGIPLVLLD